MTTQTALRPTTVEQLAGIIGDAAKHGDKLAITGGGTKAPIGAPCEAIALEMTGFAGVIDYDPAELVLTIGAGTPLSEVQDLVASERQMLAFDPFDHSPLFGVAGAHATIGGIVAAGVSGSLRLTQGGARDHLLGFTAVSGRGEPFVAGAKVVKNVTGYDLSKLVTGSWGRLAALTQVTLKVMPRARMRTTKLIAGLNPEEAVKLMSRALGSQTEIWAAAYVPDYQGRSITALRLEGFPASVQARCQMLDSLLRNAGPVETLDDLACQAFWHAVATLSPLSPTLPLWRIILPPKQAPALMKIIEGQWLLDWAGGLAWVTTEEDAARMRAATLDAGGHATLIRASAGQRAATAALQPRPAGVAALEERVRRAFDPMGVFETGRF